jgi:carboxypeptidase family protein
MMMRNFRQLAPLALVLCGLLCASLKIQAQTPNAEPGEIPSGPYRIAGRVVNSKGGSPLTRTRVTIADAKIRENIQYVVTADDGRFEFHVPAGKFALQGAKRGFITAAYNQHDQFSTAIVTGADVDAANLTLRLAPNAVLSGRVLDESGEPVRNAQITVYRENRFSGISQVSRYRSATTDDQGRYEVATLDEGTYFVSAKATPWYAVHAPSASGDATTPPSQVDPTLDVAYSVTFYGDTTDTDSASPIPVRGGDRLEADIHLTPAPALHLLFRFAENSQVAFPQLQRQSFDGVEDVEGNIQGVSPGVYELTGIAAGRYMVRMPDSNGQLREPTSINLTSSQELDGSSGNSTSKVKVTIEGTGSSTTGVPPQLQLGLRDNKGKVIRSEVDTKGEANFADVIPGKYDVLAGSQNQVFSVQRISWEGGGVSGRSLTIPAGASVSISVSLLGGSATVEGFAKRNGKGVDGAMVVLIPKDPEANHDRFRRDQTDLDGSFSLYNVSPGSYTVIAIENGWDLDWAKPAVLANYGRHGQSLVIRAQTKGTIRLPEPIAAE